MLPDVGIVKYVSNVPWSWRMLTWVVRMPWHSPPCFYTFPPVGFSMQLLDRGHHPYISTGFSRNTFTPLWDYNFTQYFITTLSTLIILSLFQAHTVPVMVKVSISHPLLVFPPPLLTPPSLMTPAPSSSNPTQVTVCWKWAISNQLAARWRMKLNMSNTCNPSHWLLSNGQNIYSSNQWEARWRM